MSTLTVSTGLKRQRSGGAVTVKKRRTAKRKSTFGYPRNAIARVGRAFPEKIRTTLRYVEHIQLTAASGATTNPTIFNCNGLYDPYYPVGGHQPYGFDQYMAIYNHYSVQRATIRCTFQRTPAATTSPVIVGINDDDDGTDAATFLTRMEKSGRKNYGWVGDNNGALILSSSWSCKKKFGANPNALDKNIGGAASLPTEVTTWHVWMNNQGSVTEYVNVICDIEYDVEFTELKDFGPS